MKEAKEYTKALENLLKLKYNQLNDKNKIVVNIIAINCGVYFVSCIFPSSTLISKIFTNSV